MRTIVLALRDIVVTTICAAALVAFVLDYALIGAVLGLFGAWQIVRIFRSQASIIGIDQRYYDREGKPNIRG
jgi:hypothetical protein